MAAILIDSKVDYERIVSGADTGHLTTLICKLSEELPYEWADAYQRTTPHRSNILRISRDGFEYLFDFSSELVIQGELAKDKAVEDRIVAVHGCSQLTQERRRDSLMRKHPQGPVDFIRAHSDVKNSRHPMYDKGHFIGHSLGGMLHINLFAQSKQVNRGWSEQGKVYRKMERYCERHPGTYCFSRPIYGGFSGHPQIIEFGVLMHDARLWVVQFPNCQDSEEVAKIERLFRAKIAGANDEGLRSIL